MTNNDEHSDALHLPPSGTSVSTLPRNVKVLGAASLLNDIASEMTYPLIPAFLTTVLKGSLVHVGILEGVADTAASLTKLYFGAWSDRTGGRKTWVVGGYVLAALARPFAGLALVPWHLFSVRTIDRIGKGIRTSPRDALIADSTEPSARGRAHGFHRAMDHLGAALGPLVAMAFLFVWPGQLRWLFFLTIIPGLLTVALVVWGLKEPKVIGPAKPRVQLSLAPLDHNFRRYLLALAVFALGNSTDAFLLVRAGSLGVPQVLLPLLWLTFHLVKSVGNLAAGGWVDRVGPRIPLFVGWTIYAVTYGLFAVANQAWQAWALFLLYGVFYSLTEPAERALVTRLCKPENKGLAFGWFNFSQGVLALPSSVLFGALYEYFGALTAFGCGAVLALVAVLIFATVKDGQVPDMRPTTSKM